MPQSKRATIKDIAREAGVSTASVSQALRPRSDSNIKLQEETVERIKSVANKLNYRPHAGARSIRSKQFGTLGYFMAKEGLFTHSPAGYMAGVHDEAEENDFRITLIRLPHKLDEIRDTIPSVFTEHNLDALVIESYSEISEKIHKHLKDIRLPVIYLNDNHQNNSVFVDDTEGARKLTQYMIDKGHRDLCFVLRTHPGGSHDLGDMHHSAPDRIAGYREIMLENGLDPKIITIESDVVGRETDLSHEQWKSIEQHKSIIVYDDDLANLVGRYCYKNQIKIPQQLAIGSFNGDYGSLCSWMHLTTVKMPSYEMGRQATQMALELVQSGNSNSIPSKGFSPTLIIGETA